MRSSEAERLIRRLAEAQHGMFTWRQLRELGVSRGQLDHRFVDGRIRRQHRGVYTLDRVVTLHGTFMAAVLAVGDATALSCRSAGRHRGVLRIDHGPVHVTRARSARNRAGIRVHRHALTPEEVEVIDGIPVTTVARTLIDLAETEEPLRLHKAIDSAFDLRLVSSDEIEATIELNPHRLGSRRLLAALDAHAWGAHRGESAGEDALIPILLRAGLPLPETQYPMVLADGTQIRPDAVWPRQRVIVELDGESHFNERRARHDRRRDALLTADGWRVLRFTYEELHRDPDLVVAAIARALSSPSA